MEDSLLAEVLLERDLELARINGRLSAACAGEGGLLVVEGPAGIGKSTLIRATRAQAEERRMQVLEGRGAELELEFAFGVIRQALERPLAELDAEQHAAVTAGPAAHAAALFDPAGSAVSSEALLHGLYWLVANLAERRPAVLAIDDAHWTDESSLRALAFLTGRIHQLPVVIALSTRPPDVETSPTLVALAGDPLAERLTPAPLGESAIATLAGSDDPEFIRAAARATGGNPFLLDQLLRALEGDRTAGAVGRVEPRRLGRLVLARVGEDARLLARALVILGERATLAQCAALAEVDARSAIIEELVAAGVLADDAELRFRHPLIASAVAAELSAARRSEWHARAAAMLRDSGADLESVAAHLAASAPEGRADVADTLSQAAGRAFQRGSPATAESLLRRALAEPPDESQRGRIQLSLGEVLSATGEEETRTVLAEVIRSSGDPRLMTRALEVRARVGWAQPAAGAAAELAEIDRLIGNLGPSDGAELRIRLEAARLTVAQRSPELMNEAIARAVRLKLLSSWGPPNADLLGHAALWHMRMGAPADVCVAYALRASQASGDAYRAIPPGLWFPFTMIVLQGANRLEEAGANARSLQRATREYGSATWYGLTTQWLARVLQDEGRLLEAEEEARLAVDASGASGELWMRALPIRTLVGVLVDRGQISAAVQAWNELGLGATIPAERPMNELLVTRARLRDAAGDKAGALLDLEEADRRIEPAWPDSINDQEARLHRAVLYHVTGERALASSTAATARGIAERWDTDGAIGCALHVQALVEEDPETLALALTRLEASPLRLARARAAADLGAMLRRRGARREARAPLLLALEEARACGAEMLVARTAEELEATGVRVPVRRGSGGDSLTPSERRIARMAAAGASNKEIAQELFLSVKTIEMHLHHTYRKLDIASRRELPGVVGRRLGSSG